ncbi:putative cytochrome P450 [Aspergillus sclerotiicarbonarius CBS 121057]|uniref:Putative cytochrome P450 n=1 Tax=Aspergillus sclerotiicarbonarius (strain CBS 121057 / IBT 28362) TaxID=1448318 RepID=A0A319ELX4_ASPSB|nr:putative cytochrome P450 [Aspergillus sclerotiicarbonarius CBS 121057]
MAPDTSEVRSLVQGISDHPFILSVIVTICFLACLIRLAQPRDNIPPVNRMFSLEPALFSRLRFAFNARIILADAYKKVGWSVARGDVDFIVLPAECVTELNRLPRNILSSRQCHAITMMGHLNGMDVVLKTDLHVRLLLKTISPALPKLLRPASTRMAETMHAMFPQDTEAWTVTEMADRLACCVERGLAFLVMFIMRFVPAILQPLLVWMLPPKWRLRAGLKGLETFMKPEAERQKERKDDCRETTVLPNLFNQMIDEARNECDQDPGVLTQLLTALAAGGTYSAANFIFAVLADLATHPHFLAQIREEFQAKHVEIGGRWDFEAFDNLPKLDSAFKETQRLTPGSLTTYSRVMLEDHPLANGVILRKGQLICVDSYSRSMDDRVYPEADRYDALRAYNQDLHLHTSRPFKGVYGHEFRWGSGRWACAGRHLAAMMGKFMLVKLLDEYDFQLVGAGERPGNTVFHEFVFIHPGVKMAMRRRKGSLGIQCC